jgi:diacylglycerol kinase (ATP)
MNWQRSTSLFQSFNFAAEGIVHAVRTQRNLWIHFAVAVAVLVAAIGFGATKLELAVLLISITFVLVAELVNTAVEATVDVASTEYSPTAKIAKDIAAGAVLVAALNSVAVGYLVFSGEVATRSSRFLTRLSDAPTELTLVALAVTVILVVAVKAYTGRGTLLRGGLPSGHAAVAFSGWMAVTLVLEGSPRRFLVSSVTFIMAVLVAQTRVESGVHTASEVALGGVLGALVTLLLFQAFG